jgi:hypothetical protein
MGRKTACTHDCGVAPSRASELFQALLTDSYLPVLPLLINHRLEVVTTMLVGPSASAAAASVHDLHPFGCGTCTGDGSDQLAKDSDEDDNAGGDPAGNTRVADLEGGRMSDITSDTSQAADQPTDVLLSSSNDPFQGMLGATAANDVIMRATGSLFTKPSSTRSSTDSHLAERDYAELERLHQPDVSPFTSA